MPYNEMSSLRRRPCSPATAMVPPLEHDGLLSKILVRLSSQPSSIPRASAICKRWRHLVRVPRFLCRYRLCHRRSPLLLGFFDEDLVFTPTGDPPNRIPCDCFYLSFEFDHRLLGCNHGLVLISLTLQK